VELVLYISSVSPPSIQARRNLERLLDGFDKSQVKFTVCDLVRDPLAGDADRITFTPTLVKRYPQPPIWVLGNLKETGIVFDRSRQHLLYRARLFRAGDPPVHDRGCVDPPRARAQRDDQPDHRDGRRRGSTSLHTDGLPVTA
jgi:hypothetical protein